MEASRQRTQRPLANRELQNEKAPARAGADKYQNDLNGYFTGAPAGPSWGAAGAPVK
jgi:hypothetical protein